MDRWLTYLRERFPALSYLLLVGGIALSGVLSAHDAWSPQVLAPLAISAIGLLLFFAELRLMDELKDCAKDVVAHPERPLPRGLVGMAEARAAMRGLLVAMVAWAALSAAVCGWQAGACYALVTGWLWLMYREFYSPRFLAPRPLLYALSHQIILFPVAAYPALAADASMVRAPHTWFSAVSVLGAFFAYEICRKLDPQAHPVLKTYLGEYGPAKTWALVALTCGVAALGAYGLGLGKLLWPFEAALIACGALLVRWPGRYKIVEGVATLSLLVHLWSVAISRAVGVL